jgi:hypothetical protein
MKRILYFAIVFLGFACTISDSEVRSSEVYGSTSTLAVDMREGAQSSFQFIFSRNYTPGSRDENGQYMGGTETTHLVAHDGKLWAGIGYWRDNPGGEPSPGAQVLVKSRSQDPWVVDHSWIDTVRVDALTEVTFTTDGRGVPLTPPKSLLLASVSEASEGKQTAIWSRNSASGTWSKAVLSEDSYVPSSDQERPYVRVIQDHIDQSTGIHYVFAGAAKGAIYKGVYDPNANGQIRWDSQPEFYPGRNRIHAMAIANNRLYATVGRDNESDVGGLYKRVDGSNPTWQRVYQWPNINRPRYYGGMRGLTTLPATDHQSHELLLGAREQPGVIELIDPNRNYDVIQTFNYREYFRSLWGGLGGAASIAAYNEMTSMTHPDTGEKVHLIGLWINHPSLRYGENELGLSSWYLIRRENGEYEHGQVFDSQHLFPDAPGGLRASRTIVVSPFPEDRGRVLYFGGYDAGGSGRKHNTAWIYRAVLPDQ